MNKNKNKKENILKSLDPRMVLYCYAAFIILVFVAGGLIGAGVTLLAAVGLWAISEMSFKKLWEKVSYAVIITFAVCVIVAIASSVLIALSVLLRICSMIIISVLYLNINSIYDRLDAMTGGFHTTNSFSMNFSRAFHFLPSLGSNMKGLVLAARYRGIRLEELNVWQKVKLFIILQIPALQNAFHSFKCFGEAAELRCYDLEAARRRMKPFKYRRIDILAAAVMVLYAALLVVLRILF